MAEDEVVGARFRVYRSSAGYVRIDHVEGARLVVADAVEELEAVATLTGGAAVPLLVDIRGLHSITREARTTFANTTLCTRLAMYVDSSLTRTIANFFLGVTRPDISARVFTDIDEACAWLGDTDG